MSIDFSLEDHHWDHPLKKIIFIPQSKIYMPTSIYQYGILHIKTVPLQNI